MTPRVLFVGCSFLCDLHSDYETARIIHMPGAGNQLIAATVLHELSKQSYDAVYVTWTGINRVDVPISIDFHNSINSEYEYCRQLNDTVWYSSGGIGASGSSPQCPAEIKKMFHMYYVGATTKYLTDMTLSSIITVQSLLEQKQLAYRMSFIYDIDNFEYGIGWLSAVLGTLDHSSLLTQLVDWDKLQTKNTPFEWCQQHNLLKDDGFHPTKQGISQWILENFELDVAKFVD